MVASISQRIKYREYIQLFPSPIPGFHNVYCSVQVKPIDLTRTIIC